ncbi:DivIVA domain-containing protein [soil metagenome]
MPLTPADVHNVVFKKPPIGKRGYDEDEVDAFLDVVEAELARLIEENAELRALADRVGGSGASSRDDRFSNAQTSSNIAEPARAAPPPPPPALAPAPPAPEPARAPAGGGGDSDRTSRVLQLATETADRYVSEATAEAEQLRNSAKAESDRVLSEARNNSERMLSEAKSRAESMVSEAKNRAETMERDARAKASAITQDVERKQVETLAALEEKRVAAEKNIDQLRTFEREYRSRLKSYLELHLRELNGRGSAEPSGPAARPGTAGQQGGDSGLPVAAGQNPFGGTRSGPGAPNSGASGDQGSRSGH